MSPRENSRTAGGARKVACMDAGFFAGVVAGEGCFSTGERNAGQSRQCTFSLNMRADDTPLVQGLRDYVGCGRIYARAAQGRAKPQVSWQVNRADDCARLAEVLEREPLLNKKAGDFAIWSEAVSVWRSGEAGRWKRMDALARVLRAHRDPGVVADRPAVDVSRHYLSGFLAGFATAEAHFGAQLPAGKPTFVLRLRADDRAILDFLAAHFDIGRVAVRPGTGRAQAVATWTVTGCDDLRRLASVLDRFPPRGRQGRVYEAWRELLDVATEQRGCRCSATERLRRRESAWYVRAQRAYCRPAPLPRHDGRQAGRERCLAALRDWAASDPAAYTATAYTGWRSSAGDHPSRNTVARALGSWHAALEAAGLPTDDCHAPSRAAAIGAAGRDQVAASRESQRRTIIDAVQRCAAELGHWPRATEFFRWRLKNALDTPSQMTVYRAFPGGWAEVLEAATGAELQTRSRPAG